MWPLLYRIKDGIEKASGCRIYRNTLPHGIDHFVDIERRLGNTNIKVIFDVGANVGQTALHYSRHYPEADIYSFEPVAGTYRELVAATSQLSRVHTFNTGMGRTAGTATIHVNSNSAVSSILLERPDDHSETIEVDTISNFAAKQHLEEIHFLKIDTEGYDLEVLAGAIPLLQEQKIHYIMCECEPIARTKRYVSFPDLADFLGRYGYLPFGIYDQQPDQPDWFGQNCLLYWNALFICEKLVNQSTKP